MEYSGNGIVQDVGSAKSGNLVKSQEATVTTAANADQVATVTSTEEPVEDILFKLPPEVRNMIYEEAMFSYRPVRVYSHLLSLRKDGAQPSLTRLCRSIRSETLPNFYGMTIFRLGFDDEDKSQLTSKWLQAIGPLNRSYLKHLYIRDLEFDVPIVENGDRLFATLERAPKTEVSSNRFGCTFYRFDRKDLDLNFFDE